MRKVLIPIHIKLMMFFIVILSITLSFYVFYAVDLFEKDKSAYVFEAVKNQNDLVATTLSNEIQDNFRNLELINKLNYNKEALKALFEQNPKLKAFIEFKKGKIINEVLALDLTSKEEEKIKTSFLTAKLDKTYGHLNLEDKLGIWKKTNDSYSALILNKSYFEKFIKENSLYNYFIFDHLSEKNFFNKDSNLLDRIIKSNTNLLLKKGTFIASTEGERYIVSYFEIINGLRFYTVVNEDRAYEASSVLKRKSIYYGVLVLAVTIILVMFFAKLFTTPIEKLFQASQKYSKNEFDYKVELSNKDELGVLADSFNQMSDSIITYMDEMKEKNRLENELQTARIVQKSFFPIKKVENKNYSLSAYYQPATECGGDWWGQFEIDNKIVVLIIDATGHGTPAALVTAITYNCLTMIKEKASSNKEFLTNPLGIMQLINNSICSIHNDMLATGFVMIYDSETKELQYSNASHNAPFLIENKENLTKNDITPLLDSIGKRFGEDESEIYSFTSLKISNSSKILLYTDGLIEGENNENKAWGKRNFLKSILGTYHEKIDLFLERISEDAFSFYQGKKPDDDITLVGLEIK